MSTCSDGKILPTFAEISFQYATLLLNIQKSSY